MAVVVTGFGASAAQAAGTFECTATALRVGTASTSVANPQGTPCANDLKAPINANVPLGTLGSVQAIGLVGRTQANHPEQAGIGHGGNAQAGAAGVVVTLLGQQIGVGVIRSLIFMTCPTGDLGPGTPPPTIAVQPQSDTAGVTLNGNEIAKVNQAITLPIGVATIYLNRTISSPNRVTQRALEIQSPLIPGGITVGESTVGYTGNPCTNG